MLNKLMALVVIFLSISAMADIPIPPGTKVTEKISGRAAQILYDSLAVAESRLPSEFAFKNECGISISSGRVQVTRTEQNGTVTIACSSFYCRGYQAVCHLQEIY